MSPDAVLDAGQRRQIDALRASLPVLSRLPFPGGGRTLERWDHLVAAGRDDLAQARLVEGHLDALAILHELDRCDLIHPSDVWGVWAAEPRRTMAARAGGGWSLRGAKAFCSGAGGIDRALVTATSDDGPRLFAVPASSVAPRPDSWNPIGMQSTASYAVDLDMVVPSDAAVGGPGSYTDRPGFWHGGAGVAACWFGGAIGVLQLLDDHVAATEDDDHAAAQFGRLRARLDACGALLHQAAATIDRAPTDARIAKRTALTTRIVIEEAARTTLDGVGVTMGARSLCSEPSHAARVADLTVYLRQLDVASSCTELGRLASERAE